MGARMSEDGRRQHYGEFYGLRPLRRTDAPLLLVFGNCQAEALRIAISGAGHAEIPLVDSLRTPPVHELTADDVPHLQRWLARVDLLVAQPVRDGYRDLPLGTDEVAGHLPAGAVLVRIPSIRYAGLYPYQELVRGEGLADPPLVPYHDLRWLAAAAGLAGGPQTLTSQARRTAYRRIAADSLAELARRERVHETIPVSDVVAAAGAGAGWTINHPGNAVLLGLAQRVLAHVGLPGTPADPGRVLLRSVRTPLLAEVVEALELADTPPRPDWLVDGESVSAQAVSATHTEFYAQHPHAVAGGVEAHAARLELLGWSLC